jgi:acetyl-CoA carboxylase biotin carboxyl carrier protein
MAKKSKPESGGAESSGVNLDDIERLLSFMQAHDLQELEYQHGDLHVRLKKASAAPAGALVAQPQYLAPQAAVAGPAEFAAPAAAPAPASARASDNVHTIKSPIVGTFYAAPSPEAEAFVAVGASVEAGQVLCIIEAMKLMNEIESDVAGEVVRIHAENGKPVEYGAPLFDIRTRAK